MNVWLHNEKMIILLLCYNFLVLTALLNLNKRVFIANEFSFSLLKLLASPRLDSLWAEQLTRKDSRGRSRRCPSWMYYYELPPYYNLKL